MLSIGQKVQVTNPATSLFGEIGTIVEWIKGPGEGGFVVKLEDGGKIIHFACEELSSRIMARDKVSKTYLKSGAAPQPGAASPCLAVKTKITLEKRKDEE